MNPDDPSPPVPPRNPLIGGLEGLAPGEMLAMGLNTVQPPPGTQPWVPPTPEELAALLPQYGITALLGSGGMGAVYRGAQSSLDRPIAIKLLPAEMAADPEFIARFQREARTLAKLQHPGIVAVHDFGQTPAGHLYFVMEYVDGTDLHRIFHGPGLKPAQALELISQICDALHYAHRQRVIHRDIKPANILVTKDGRAKVADFGLARPLQEDAALSGSSAVMGTDAYMAPEQRQGHADQRADIFALGVMLYEMLTGQRPHGVFAPPSHKKVQIDIRLDEVVLKALQEEPERRYQQAGEMKTDVDRIRTTPHEGIERGRQKAERKTSRVRAAAVIVACVVLASAAGVTIWGKWKPSRAASAQSSPALQRDDTTDGLKPSTTLPAAATKEAPFVNSLGMRFVPVPETKVLFSIWETRVQDFTAFAQVNRVDPTWQMQRFDDSTPAPVSREPLHPACGVNWDDAKWFCRWVTEKETNEGKLPNGATYRLPTDEEWSRAVGLPSEEGATPQEKSGRNDTDFPWGKDFPPKSNVGNYADASRRELLPGDPWIDGYTDGFAATAPVGSFPANQYGVFDLGGNVWEWCEDWFDASQTGRVGRGGGWSGYMRGKLLSSNRGTLPPSAHYRNGFGGFRCVLDPDGAAFLAKDQVSAKVSAASISNSEKPALAPAATGQSPRRMGTDNDWKAIAAGERHALAIKTDGSLWAWGQNAFGQLGIGERENRQSPVRVGSDNDWIAVAGSSQHSVALKSDGSLWTWGQNQYGQLGDGTKQDRSKPERVGTEGNWRNIFAASSHILALKSDGSLWGWGNNNSSQLGDATRNARPHPAQTGLDRDWIAVRTGHSNSVALKSDDSLWVWGSSDWSHAGKNYFEIVPRPTRIGLDRSWSAIGARNGRIYAIGKDETLWGCGMNSYGEVGIGRNSPRVNWTQIGTDIDWKLVAPALHETFALKTNGSFWAWGRNNNGQLGDGTTIDRPSPVRIGTDTDWETITASHHGALGLKQDGSLWAWGLDF